MGKTKTKEIMRHIIVTVMVLTSFASCIAQKNLFYGELGGAGPIGSLNYERQVLNDSPLMLRAGLGYVTSWSYSDFTIPTGLYYLIDLKRQNHLELGATYTFALNTQELDGLGFFLPAIGYRKYAREGKSFFKITLSPVIFNNDPVEIIPWGGISFGTFF